MNSGNADYRVELDAYAGPLDLLLYLIRRNEVDIADIPIAEVTDQYVQYINLMEKLNVEHAGEFLVMAATLMEIKSRMLLPEPPEGEEDEDWIDPRLELVQQLLEYKKYKEAASALALCADEQAQRFPRPGELPESPEPHEKLPGTVSTWQLLEAFNRILVQTGRGTIQRIVADDTPVEVFMHRLLDSLEERGRLTLSELASEEGDLGALVGLFLALLELIRLGRVTGTQDELFGPIYLSLIPTDPAGQDQVIQNDRRQ